MNFVCSQGSHASARPQSTQRAAVRRSTGCSSHSAPHATSSAPGISGKIAQLCGMKGTVKQTPSQVSAATVRPASNSARSNTASAVSAAIRPMKATAPR